MSEELVHRPEEEGAGDARPEEHMSPSSEGEPIEPDREGTTQEELAAEGDGEANASSDAEPESAATPEAEAQGTPEDAENMSPPAPAPEVSQEDRAWAMVSYLAPFMVPLLVLLVEPNRYRKFQRYHAIQALALFVASVLYEVILISVLGVLFSSGILACVGILMMPLMALPVLLFVWYAVLAYNGRWFSIPVLTDFLRQQKWV